MLLVLVGFWVQPQSEVWAAWSLLEHAVTPVLVVVDVVLVRRLVVGRRWQPATWLLPPLAYLAWYVAADLGVYVDLDRARPGGLLARSAGLLVVLLTAAALLARTAEAPSAQREKLLA